jgi:hypothetical protein
MCKLYTHTGSIYSLLFERGYYCALILINHQIAQYNAHCILYEAGYYTIKCMYALCRRKTICETNFPFRLTVLRTAPRVVLAFRPMPEVSGGFLLTP